MYKDISLYKIIYKDICVHINDVYIKKIWEGEKISFEIKRI